MIRKHKKKIYYGYFVAAACFAIQGIGIGTLVSFGVFFKPLLSEFGWSRAALAGASSVTFLLGGIIGIFVGTMNDRFGPRIIMSVTAGFLGVGYLLMSQLTALWQVYLFYGVVIGIGMSSIDVIALSTTARWFVRKRGTLTGMVKVGTGAGQATIPLLAGFLISSYGWRTAYMFFGIFILVLLISISQVLKRDPSEMGLLPDGDEEIADNETGQAEGLTLAEALKTPQYWIICLVNMLVLYCLLTVMMHIVPHAMDLGVSAIKAAGILSTFGAASIVSRFCTGLLIDRIGNKKTMVICFFILIASFLWLLIADNLWMLYLFAAAYGLAHGGFFTVISPIVADFFGLKSHGILFGVAAFSGAFGGAIGPVVAGYVFDITASYQMVIVSMIVISAAGLFLLSFLKPAVRTVGE